MQSLRVHVQPRLPPELIDNIIDHLHDSPPDLRACALVCGSWVAPSRLHLFYSISIYSSYRRTIYDRCCRLWNAIKRSPCVALYVKELCFQPKPDSISANSDFSEISRLRRVLPELLRLLTRLRKLKLVRVLWISVMPFLETALFEVLTLPSLEHFEIENLHLSMEQFARLLRPQLKRLTIRGKVPWYVDAESQASREVIEEQPCRPEYLELSITNSAFVDWILDAPPTFDISNVRTFNVTHYDGSFSTTLDRLMSRLAMSLEHLIIHRACEDYWIPQYNSHRLPNLKILTFDIDVEPYTTFYLQHLFSRLALPNLQQIRLHLKLSHQGVTLWKSWMAVKRIFDSWVVPSLYSVKISSQVEPDRPQDKIPMLRLQIINRFPLLVSRGMLEVEVKENMVSVAFDLLNQDVFTVFMSDQRAFLHA